MAIKKKRDKLSEERKRMRRSAIASVQRKLYLKKLKEAARPDPADLNKRAPLPRSVIDKVIKDTPRPLKPKGRKP